MRASDIDVDDIVALYEKYGDDLPAAREAQRRLRRQWNPRVKWQLHDVEAEISCLARRRSVRPTPFVRSHRRGGRECSCRAGRTTLDPHPRRRPRASRRGAHGRRVPVHRRGHTGASALVPRPAVPVTAARSHGERARRVPSRPTAPVHRVVRAPELVEPGGIGYVTAAGAHGCEVADQLAVVRATHSFEFDDPIHTGRDNPMIFFTIHRQCPERMRGGRHARR